MTVAKTATHIQMLGAKVNNSEKSRCISLKFSGRVCFGIYIFQKNLRFKQTSTDEVTRCSASTLSIMSTWPPTFACLLTTAEIKPRRFCSSSRKNLKSTEDVVIILQKHRVQFQVQQTSRKKQYSGFLQPVVDSLGLLELQYTWLKNFGAVGRNNCRTCEWKILVMSEKKELQYRWLENFGTVGKKELQNTWL